MKLVSNWRENSPEEQARFYRERHAEAVRFAKEFGLDDMAKIIEEGWDEEEGRCHGSGSTLEYVIFGLKHNNYMKDFSNLFEKGASEHDRAYSWFWFNGFNALKRRWNSFNIVLEKYIRAMVDKKGEGYRDIRFLMPWIVGMRFKRKQLAAACEDAIKKDSWSGLNIYRDIGVMKFTKPVVRDILRADNQGDVAERLILESKEFEKFFNPREALLHLCAACPNDEKCVRLGKLLVAKDPDICKRPDINGYTPLVYTYFIHRCAQMSGARGGVLGRRVGFERFLVDNGCDPDYKDRFGLSWQSLNQVAKEYISCW